MKKIIGCFISAVLAIVLALGVTGCTQSAAVNPDAYSFVTIDINPSVELVTLGNNVLDVKAANYDACVLLEGEDFSSLTVEEATAKIVRLAEELGYLTDDNNGVKISVISDDAPTVEALKSAAKAGAEKGSKKAVATTETRLQDELTLKKLKEEKPDKFDGLTEEKVRLIGAVMEYDGTMTYEDGADMTVNQLSEYLTNAIAENRQIFTSELRAEYSARYAAAKRNIERQIAAYYGEEYLAGWETYTALESVYNSIVTEIEKSGLSEADVDKVMQLLGITDLSLIEKGGSVKPEYVYSYIDKHINKKGSQTEQAAVEEVIGILEMYSAESHAVTEAEAARIAEATGEDLQFDTLGEIAANLAERKAELEEIKSAVELTDGQIAEIVALKDGFSAIKDSVLEEMSGLIDEAREAVAAAKQERAEAV